jgi:hypothetical protein
MSRTVTVRLAAEARVLALLETVTGALGGITDSAAIAHIEKLLGAVSDTFERATERSFGRELVTEKFGLDDLDVGNGYAGTHRIMLSRRPILMVEALRYNGEEQDVSSLVLEDAETGFLFSRDGLSGTVLYYQQLERQRTRFKDPLWEVDYSAGYVLPTFPRIQKDFLGADVNITNDLISIAAHGLILGDTVRFLNAGGALPAGLSLNRDYYVRDVLSGSFKLADRKNGAALDITDVGTGTHTVVRQSTLPVSLEMDCVAAVVSEYHARARDRAVTSESLGDYSVSYNKLVSGGSQWGLPGDIESRLEKWRDLA